MKTEAIYFNNKRRLKIAINERLSKENMKQTKESLTRLT